MNYSVTFELGGETKSQTFGNCHDVGNAFWKCHRKYPEAKLLGATVQGQRGQFWINYDAASTVEVPPLPLERVEQDEMPLDDPRDPK